MKVVIVGGVAAGASTGARVRRLDDSAEIVILERGRYVSFANCGLPYHIGGEIPDRNSLLLQTPESLAASLALDVRTGHEVVGIDPAAKEVEVREVEGGRTYRETYDKLVLCPGAEPIRPPIPGADLSRVDVLRNIPDMDRIINELDASATRAVVIGGSYIGLEMAEAFRTRGLDTAIVERTDRLMPWLDPEMTRILDFHVTTHGVDIRLGSSAKAIREKGPELVVELSDGSELTADVVVLAVGVRPNAELAQMAGVATGPLGGIGVDPQMRTSVPDILAAGDAVETAHLLTGEPVLSMLAGPANREGRIAAETICGHESCLSGQPGHGHRQGVRHGRRRDGPDRGPAARARDRAPQGVHPPERPRRVLPGQLAHVHQGALHPVGREAAGRPGAGLGRRGQADRRVRDRSASRHDRLRPRARRAVLRASVRIGQGSRQHDRVPGLEPAARRHRPLVCGGLPGVRRERRRSSTCAR